MRHATQLFIKRSVVFSVSLAVVFSIALFLDDDFPRLVSQGTWYESIWLFMVLAKWALLMGAIVYISCYVLLGKPNTISRQVILLNVMAGMAYFGPMSLFDVAWIGGPWGSVMTVYPTLYNDMQKLFTLCAIVFYLFYMAIFWLVPSPQTRVATKTEGNALSVQ